MDKAALRRAIREKKRAMTEEEIVSRSEKLGELLARSEAYQAAKTVYGYLPYNQEARVEFIEFVQGKSTTNIIQKINNKE